MIYGGIDVAKHRHEVCLVNDAGDVVLQMHIDNSKRGLNKLLHALERLGIEPDGVKFCLEATGHYWLPVLLPPQRARIPASCYQPYPVRCSA